MFANLKNKLIEEVKASPSKFQQFANAAQAAVSSSTGSTPSSSDTTTTTNENFFSITEEDTPQNSPYRPLKLPTSAARGGRAPTPQSNNGAIPRTRKLSNSSVASDVSFRLPSYDSPSVYHLQSDFDESGSEMGDTASTAKLDAVSKEQLFEAYKKSLDRYHRYRSRYTDLAKKYKDLERDSAKARAVLVETQDKAIRRISELREQCGLEQQAKAHLEELLRLEMDDMQCKMQAYEMKLKLLGENPENITAASVDNESLIDLSGGHQNNGENGTNLTNAIAKDISQETDHIAQLEKQLAERNREVAELKAQMDESKSTIELLRKQEEENALLLAQTKQAIHSELENKESEVKKLTDSVKKLQQDIQTSTKKEAQLAGQMGEFKELKDKLKHALAAKQESDARIIATEHVLTELKAKFTAKEKALTAAEEKIATLTRENEQKLQDLRQQNVQLTEMVERYQVKEVSLAEVDNELNRTKNENDNLRKELEELRRDLSERVEALEQSTKNANELKMRLDEETAKAEALAKQLADVSEQKEQQDQRLRQLESEMRILSEQNANNESETIAALKAELQRANNEMNEQLVAAREQLAGKEKELKALGNKLSKQKKQHDNQQNKLKERGEEIENLRLGINEHEEKLQALERESHEREAASERETMELRSQLENILRDIGQMEEQVRTVEISHKELETEKLGLEARIEEMIRDARDSDQGSRHLLDRSETAEERLRQVESKLQEVQSENSQLAEKNCLLEENSHRLEKLQATEHSNASELRADLAVAEDTIRTLNEKMAQLLDENSRLHNAQELMDHDCRSLQDKCDTFEKEAAVAQDSQKSLADEIAALRERKRSEEIRMQEIVEQLQQTEEQLAEEKKKGEVVAGELKDVKAAKKALEKEVKSLGGQLGEIRAHQSDDDKLRDLLREKESRVVELEAAMAEKDSEITANALALREYEIQAQAAEGMREELVLLSQQRESLSQELQDLRAELDAKAQSYETELLRGECAKLKEEMARLEAERGEIMAQMEAHKKALSEKEEEQKALIAKLAEESRDAEQRSLQSSAELQEQLRAAHADVEKLHEGNDALQLEVDNLKVKHELQVESLEKALSQLQEANASLKEQAKAQEENAEKASNYEQLRLENEYLNKHVRQLEVAVEEQKRQAEGSVQGSEELREKLKSIQCELYVLTENAAKHDSELRAKEDETAGIRERLRVVEESLEAERAELQRQMEHSSFVNDQNDSIQQDLLHSRQIAADLEQKLRESAGELDQLRTEIAAKEGETQISQETIARLEAELKANGEAKQEGDVVGTAMATTTTTTTGPTIPSDAEHLREMNELLQRELEDLKHKSSGEIMTLQHEIEDMQSNEKQMSERIMELERLRAGLQAQRLLAPKGESGGGSGSADDLRTQEKIEMENKLKTIMAEVQDVSNRNLFLEQKCENYLILEQSNERLKLQNAKLSRQLDETLVSMQHNENISANTEFEYLRNIMFQYLTGSANGNNETLVKVISAVLKFSPQQTQVALEKEHQRRSLINKIL